jgi:hypothetical protein
MNLLPNNERAILDIRKLKDYCLNLAHSRGRHNAQVFRKALGIEGTDAAWLRMVLLDSVLHSEAVELGGDSHGSRWRVDISVARQDRRVVVRTVWIIRTDENMPRFVTCWVL